MHRLTLVLAFLALAAPASAQVVRDDMWVTNGFVYTSTILANTLYLGGQFTRIGPATGGFMPTDATTGVRTLPALNVDGAVNAIVADGSGGFILGGSFKHYQGVARSSLARVDANGVLQAWNPGVNGIVKTIAIGGGRVYLGGDFLTVGGLPRTNAAALDLATGDVSATWVPNPTLPVHTIGYLNGLVYMGGEFFDVAGTQRAYAGSFDGVTAAATNWQPNLDGTVYTMVMRYDVIDLTTTVYIGGNFTVAGGALRRNFAMIDATVGSGTFSSALAWDPSPDGAVRVIRTVGNTIPTVYMGGDFNNIAGNPRPHLAAFTGTTLKTFNPAPDGSVVSIALSGSNLFIGGFFATVDHALRSYGALVSTSTGGVQPWDAGAGNVIRTFAQSGNTMWIGGDFTTIGAQNRGNLAAIDLSTGVATPWNPVTNGPVWRLESVGGLLYAGGTFTSVAGVGRSNVARFNPNGDLAAWTAATNGPVYAIAGRALVPSGNVVYLGGPFTACMGQGRNHLAAATDATPPVLTAWNPSAGAPNEDVRALAVDGSYVYAGGYFSSLNGQPIGGIGRVDFNGVVSPWDVNTQQPIQEIALTPTTVYVGYGGVNNFPGGQRIGVAELDKTTAALTAWNPGIDPAGVVFAIKRLGNTVYIGGLIHILAGQPREMLGAVDATTAAALPFAPAPSAWLIDPNPPTFYQLPAVLELEESDGQLYAVGQFFNIAGKPHSGVAGIFETTVSTPSVAPPAGVTLRAAPNPAGGSQALQFNLAAGGFARVAIHDVSGRVVRVLHEGALPAGPQRLEWDGISSSGVRVAPGIYFARVDAGAEHVTAKLLRVNP